MGSAVKVQLVGEHLGENSEYIERLIETLTQRKAELLEEIEGWLRRIEREKRDLSKMDGKDEALVMMHRHLLQASIDDLEAERFKVKSLDNRLLALNYQKDLVLRRVLDE